MMANLQCDCSDVFEDGCYASALMAKLAKSPLPVPDWPNPFQLGEGNRPH